MERRRIRPEGSHHWAITSLFAAALGLLQPGIDPVFLTLLSTATGLAPVDHGWIVGATQGGMAIGAVAVWLGGARLPRPATACAALLALAASLATPRLEGVSALVAARGLFGLGMGVVYTQAMSAAAARRPTGAYGGVFLIQLILSTVVALLLPMLADALDPGTALGTLALAPLGALLLSLRTDDRASLPAARALSSAIPPAAWALAAATFCFITATMMIWSFAGALATDAGIDEAMIGLAVAVGSVVGALTALAVMRERMLLPLPLTGLLCGLCLLAPLALTPRGDAGLFVLAIALLNIGSTATIIRFSGRATATSTDPLFRRFVACTHSLGMIAGPVIGSLLSATFGPQSLGGGALLALAAGCLTLLVASPAWRLRLPVGQAGEIIA